MSEDAPKNTLIVDPFLKHVHSVSMSKQAKDAKLEQAIVENLMGLGYNKGNICAPTGRAVIAQGNALGSDPCAPSGRISSAAGVAARQSG